MTVSSWVAGAHTAAYSPCLPATPQQNDERQNSALAVGIPHITNFSVVIHLGSHVSTSRAEFQVAPCEKRLSALMKTNSDSGYTILIVTT